MLKHVAAFGAVFLCLAFAAAPALAQNVAGDGKVVVPYGDWVGSAAAWAGVAVVAAGGWVLRRVPTAGRLALEAIARVAFAASVDQLIERAVGYGINAVAGASRGKVLTVDVGNRVVEMAAEYALQHAPGIVAKMGGLTRLREKIIARLELDETVAVAPVAQKLT